MTLVRQSAQTGLAAENVIRVRPIPPTFGELFPQWLAVRLEAVGLEPVEFPILMDTLAAALLAGEAGGERGRSVEVVMSFSDAANAAVPGLGYTVARMLDASPWLVCWSVELVRLIVGGGIGRRGACNFSRAVFRDSASVGLGRGCTWRPAFRQDGAQ